jgi:hypothetical protein
VVLDRAVQVVVGVLGRSAPEAALLEPDDPGLEVLRRLDLAVAMPGRLDRELAVRDQDGPETVVRTRENLVRVAREARARMVESRVGIALTMEILARGRPDSRRLPESAR